MATFAERPLTLCNQKKASQTVAARTVKITSRIYQRYESGGREASVSTSIRMTDYFRITTGYLVDHSDAR